MSKSKKDKAALYASRLINIRPRSEKELRKRFKEKGYNRATTQDIISQLKDKKIIDDEKFARLWVESRMRSNPKGVMLLRRELKEKGISDSVIEGTLIGIKEKEAESARELAEKKIDVFKKLTPNKAKKKLFDFLARRGFNFDIIEDIVKEHFK